MKRQKHTAQLKEQTKNTEVQINEEKIGKLPEKIIQSNDSKDDQNLENRMEKMQESTNRHRTKE